MRSRAGPVTEILDLGNWARNLSHMNTPARLPGRNFFERFEQPSTAQKFTIERKLQDYLQLGPQTHMICFHACPPLREIM